MESIVIKKMRERAMSTVESSLMVNSCNLLYEQSPYLFYKDQLLKRNLGYNIMESESNPIYTFYIS